MSGRLATVRRSVAADFSHGVLVGSLVQRTPADLLSVLASHG